MSGTRRFIPDRLLERAALGELPEAELASLLAEIDADPETLARLEALRRSNAEILGRYPAEAMARDIEARAHRAEVAERLSQARGKGLLRGLALAAPAMACAALLVMAVLPERDQPAATTSAGEVTRLKGGAQLIIYRRGSGGEERLEPGAQARPGDLLQVHYRAGEARYGVIVSVDGRGAVTPHFPGRPEAGALQPGALVPVAQAYELDDAPSFEVFFLVTADHPFATERVVDAAERAAGLVAGVPPAALALPAGLAQVSFLVRKGATP